MDIRNRRALKQEAAAALAAAPNEKKIIAIYTGISMLVGLVIVLLNYLLSDMVQDTSGLSNIGTRTILQTIQNVLPIAQFAVLLFWDFGYIGAMLRISRRRAADPRDLQEGFRPFGPIARLTLLQYAITFALSFACMYLGMMIFLLSPFSVSLMHTMTEIMADSTLSPMELAADPRVADAVTSATIPMTIIILIIYCLLVLPILYLFRMASYCLLDNPQAGAISALRESRNMMRRNRMNLLKLDLSFWWYYLLMTLPAMIAYADLLLPLMGISLPFNGTISYFLFYGLYMVSYFLLSVLFQNRVEVTYANAYEALRPKPQPGGIVLGNIFQM